MSPTNLGFLLNARQVACEFGFLTVPEFAEQTLRTLATMAKLPRSRGHLLNWYDTRTLEPLRPRFVSSVDSGNLVASLWTLQQGCLDLLQRPLLEKQLAEGWPIISGYWSTGMPFRRSASGTFWRRSKKEAGCSACWRLLKKDCWKPIWRPRTPGMKQTFTGSRLSRCPASEISGKQFRFTFHGCCQSSSRCGKTPPSTLSSMRTA